MFSRFTSKLFPIQPVCSRVKIVSNSYCTKKYTKNHQWISVEGNIGAFGVTQNASRFSGKPLLVQIFSFGYNISLGDEVGAIEFREAIEEIRSPVSGGITGVNLELQDDPFFIRNDPENKGWIAKIKLAKPKELDYLFDKETYDKYCKDTL
ncbi:glycine cleavage system H protein [Sporodiniella umbellata]|nr:glycine cleavage system H protein [Sporodiniella umbellata]